jgi:hypothetical protein
MEATNSGMMVIYNIGGGLTNNGTMTATGGGTIEVANGMSLTNAGTVTVGDSSTLMIDPGGTYTQTGGITQGTGTINGNVAINGGTLKPGLPDPPGALAVTGTFTIADSTFLVQIAGSGTGDYGVLNVSGGDVTLGANAQLGIDVLNGFVPAGHAFTIVTDTGGSISGVFANAPESGFTLDGYNWTIAYNTNDIVLNGSPVPLPGSVWLFLSGLMGLAGLGAAREAEAGRYGPKKISGSLPAHENQRQGRRVLI